jgi:hypothetical protein
MTQFFKKTVMVTALAASTFAAVAATPAMADPYHGEYRRGGGDAVGAAVVGGIVGLAIGAAIASDHHDRRYAPPVAYHYGYHPAAYQPVYEPAYQPYAYQVGYAAPAYGIDPEWQWRDGWFWDRGGHRHYRDGRPGDHGEYARRGYGGHEGGYRDEGYRNGGHRDGGYGDYGEREHHGR